MVRPLSNLNLILGRAQGGAGEFNPETAGTLAVWFDVSDASARTVNTSGTPDLLTNLANKAAADTANDAEATDGVSGAGAPEFLAAEVNGLDTGKTDNTPGVRVMAVTDNTQSFTRVGSAGFRLFFVIKGYPSPENTVDCVPLMNGANDGGGGGYSFHMNRAADGSGTIRFQIYDGTTLGHLKSLIVSDANNSVNDTNPHVIMIGRSEGTGTAGVDQMVCKVDGTTVVGAPVDLDATFGACENDGSVNAVAGWLLIGGAAAAPTSSQRQAPVSWGEILLYKTDMTTDQETAVVDYLKDKWGIA